MSDTECAKCLSPEVSIVPSQAKGGGAAGLMVGLGSYIALRWHICTRCGFAEAWVERQGDLDKVTKKFPPDRR